MTKDIDFGVDLTTLDWRLGDLCGDNAMNWSRAFCATCEKLDIDLGKDPQGWMVTWFANAIECAWDARDRRARGVVDRKAPENSA